MSSRGSEQETQPGSSGVTNRLPPRKINDSLYELYSPGRREDSLVEIIFFHGLQCPGEDPKDAFWKTWASRGECWPRTWLPEEGNFPQSRILSVCYDASLTKSRREGRLDLLCIAENLVQDVICSDGGNRKEGRPVFLVGHSLGGLVIKQLILQAHAQMSLGDTRPAIKTFLGNIVGIFYFSTPNTGANFGNFISCFSKPSPLVELLSVLSSEAARLNANFSKWRKEKNVKVCAVLEDSMTRVGSIDVEVVSEASARVDVDFFSKVDGDHFTVCSPRNVRSSSSLQNLMDFIKNASSQDHFLEDIVSSLSDVSLLPKPVTLRFVHDDKFVLIEKCFLHIKNALEADGKGQVITLYGGHGLGKSCMAKYVALHYLHSSTHFRDGVCYLECGPEARTIEKYMELLQMVEGNEPQSPSEVVLQGKLRALLGSKSLLIVVDNVWESELLAKLLAVCGNSKAIKYLVTSHIRNVCKDSMITRIQMERPNRDEAWRIIGQHMDGQCMPIDQTSEHLQAVIDGIIKDWDWNASILASLSMVLDKNRLLVAEEWERANKHLTMELIHEGGLDTCFCPHLYGTTYSMNVSLMKTLSSLKFPAQSLLCLASLCSRHDVPEVVLEVLFNKVESEPTRFRTWKKVLEDHSLIQIETMQGRSDPWCCWYVDSGVKHVMKVQKKLEIAKHLDSLASVLSLPLSIGEPLDRELLAALCIVYGDQELGEMALQQTTLDLGSLEVARSTLQSYVWTLVAEMELRKPQARFSAQQIFSSYATREDSSNLHNLACLPGAFEGCMMVLEMEVRFDVQAKALECLASLTRIEDQEKELSCLGNSSSNGERPIVVASMGALEALVKLLGNDQNPICQEQAVRCLGNLACRNADNKRMIASVAGVWETLVQPLSNDGHPTLQELAMRCLDNLACNNGENQARIASSAGAFEALVKLLHNDGNLTLQEQATRCLANLANNGENQAKIAAIAGALEALVKLLHNHGNPTLQEQATRCLDKLAWRNGENQARIASSAGALEALVKLLHNDAYPTLQKQATRCLTHLTSRYRENQGIVGENQARIASIAGALEALVNLLHNDGNPTLQEAATGCLNNLAWSNGENQARIASMAGVLDYLKMLSRKDGFPELQQEATTCLSILKRRGFRG